MSTHDELCNYIQNTSFADYNHNMFDFITFLNPQTTNSSKIQCQVIEDKQIKPNLCITIDQNDYYVSVLYGGGNSVHEENPSDFLNFITSLGADQATFDFIHSLCYYNSHTTDFMKTQNIQLIQHVRSFFNTMKIPIIKRALQYGQYNCQPSEFIYWGDSNSGRFCTINRAIHVLSSSTANTSLIAIGGLVLQRKNYKVNHNIQIKWPNPGYDI